MKKKVEPDPTLGFDGFTKSINPFTLKLYRTLLDNRLAGKYAHLSDQAFLLEMGLLIEEEGKAIPTKVAVLLFGQDRFVRQILPRPVWIIRE
ncbi:MAG: hypothetical protein PWP64_1101 [Candidatus Cloacimonadota bacterium]|nr:hypothetical protein [Candidatus Cloacimonadota bacterium]